MCVCARARAGGIGWESECVGVSAGCEQGGGAAGLWSSRQGPCTAPGVGSALSPSAHNLIKTACGSWRSTTACSRGRHSPGGNPASASPPRPPAPPSAASPAGQAAPAAALLPGRRPPAAHAKGKKQQREHWRDFLLFLCRVELAQHWHSTPLVMSAPKLAIQFYTTNWAAMKAHCAAQLWHALAKPPSPSSPHPPVPATLKGPLGLV